MLRKEEHPTTLEIRQAENRALMHGTDLWGMVPLTGLRLRALTIWYCSATSDVNLLRTIIDTTFFQRSKPLAGFSQF